MGWVWWPEAVEMSPCARPTTRAATGTSCSEQATCVGHFHGTRAMNPCAMGCSGPSGAGGGLIVFFLTTFPSTARAHLFPIALCLAYLVALLAFGGSRAIGSASTVMRSLRHLDGFLWLALSRSPGTNDGFLCVSRWVSNVHPPLISPQPRRLLLGGQRHLQCVVGERLGCDCRWHLAVHLRGDGGPHMCVVDLCQGGAPRHACCCCCCFVVVVVVL